MNKPLSKYLSGDSIIKAYPWIALVMGLVYLFSTPPIQSPDEQNHFYKAWHVSDGHLYAEKTSDNRLGGILPVSLQTFTDPYLQYIHCDTCIITFSDWVSGFNLPIEENKSTFIDFANTGFYFPFNYVFSALAIKITRWINASVATSFYVARIFNLLAWIGLTHWALHILPWGRLFFVIIWLLPSSLAFHISLNQDVFIHGLGFLLISWTLRWISRDSIITNKELMFFGLGLSILTLMKPTLIPLGLIPSFWMLRKGGRQMLRFSLMFIAPLICFFTVTSQSSADFIAFDQYHPDFRETQTLNPGVNPQEQLIYVLQHPLKIIWIFIVSFAKNAPSIMAHYTAKFGWLHNYPPSIIIIGLIGIIGYLQQKDIPPIDSSLRMGLIASVLVLLMGFSVTMYMLWVPVGHPDLWNLQARYFFLIAPLAFIALPKLSFLSKFNVKQSHWILFFIVAHGTMLICIMKRYWI